MCYRNGNIRPAQDVDLPEFLLGATANVARNEILTHGIFSRFFRFCFVFLRRAFREGTVDDALPRGLRMPILDPCDQNLPQLVAGGTLQEVRNPLRFSRFAPAVIRPETIEPAMATVNPYEPSQLHALALPDSGEADEDLTRAQQTFGML